MGGGSATRSARLRAISPARPPSSASRDRAAPDGVDHGDERQPEVGGQAHPAPGRAQRGRAERGVGALRPPVLAEHHAGPAAEAGQGQQQAGFGLALPGAVERR